METLRATGFRQLQRLGFHFQPNDFYSPLNDCDFLDANRDLWAEPVEPPEIDWNLEGQLAVAREVAAFVEELADVPRRASQPGVYCWENDFWNNADALVQYGLVRSRRPRRYVEIGCGWSSLLLARALARNPEPCQVTQVDPYPNEVIFAALPKDWELHRGIVQRVPLALFDALGPGDVLFYDGSHCAKVASDVNWFFFRILPRLRPGVLIHLHDIFLPSEYPEPWIFQRGQTWNEQYLLQAFLMYNPRFRVVIANRYLWQHRRDELDQLYRGVQPSHGCSFWMERAG